MSSSVQPHGYPTGYSIPLGNVLLISCMDLRLIDDIVLFMDRDNLTNRYDQFILAGAALGHFADANRDYYTEDAWDHHFGWRESLSDHVRLAMKLHAIQDIYILEHRSCGAYNYFLRNPPDRNNEESMHHKYAMELSDFIRTEHPALHVHSFLMDLRGNVEMLNTTNPDNRN